MQNEAWVSLEEVAKYLGVSKDSVHRWIRRRKMSVYKIGHLWKFKTVELDEWVRAGRSESGQNSR